ncbi:MAG TPA: TraB/GumN family protein, partial [Methanomassiliicoccaceae archaeon]|nr:TraB/GumN family protein [Methanomassiliicoccaceae archaeon]
ARSYGGEAGAEMLAAVDAARKVGSEVLMIDEDASRMFRKLWKEMPPSEKVRLMTSAFVSLFLNRRTVEKELSDFQENEERYLEEMGRQFPTMKRVLIDERNVVMARRIDAAASRWPSVVAVVGDGHVEGIVRLLGRDDLRVVRLKELMGGPPDKEGDGTGNAVARFHFHQHLR